MIATKDDIHQRDSRIDSNPDYENQTPRPVPTRSVSRAYGLKLERFIELDALGHNTILQTEGKRSLDANKIGLALSYEAPDLERAGFILSPDFEERFIEFLSPYLNNPEIPMVVLPETELMLGEATAFWRAGQSDLNQDNLEHNLKLASQITEQMRKYHERRRARALDNLGLWMAWKATGEVEVKHRLTRAYAGEIESIINNPNRKKATGLVRSIETYRLDSEVDFNTHVVKGTGKRRERGAFRIRTPYDEKPQGDLIKNSRKRKPTITTNGRPIKDIWTEFKTSGSTESRNTLVEHYLHLVRYTAERLHAKLPAEIQIDDLMQAGFFGLKDAVEAFDLERGIKFETYCTNRIRGSMLDELRAMDWVPRLARSRSTKMETARRTFIARNGVEPTREQMEQELGLDSEKIARDGEATKVVSINRKWYEADDGREVNAIHMIEDKEQEDPYKRAERNSLVQNLITKGLSKREGLIVLLYYYENLTMKEIGRTLDLSESRVSQMHTSILQRLKSHLLHREEEFQS